MKVLIELKKVILKTFYKKQHLIVIHLISIRCCSSIIPALLFDYSSPIKIDASGESFGRINVLSLPIMLSLLPLMHGQIHKTLLALACYTHLLKYACTRFRPLLFVFAASAFASESIIEISLFCAVSDFLVL